MERKEHYRGSLPHYQQPGQWYFVTCVLLDASLKFALKDYSQKMDMLFIRYIQLKQTNPSGSEIKHAKMEYFRTREKYWLMLDKFLNNSSPQFLLSKEINRIVLEEALNFWEGKRLKNHAWCIMPNHLHWVVSLFKKDENGNPVYLQDIMHSIKLFSARRINGNENHKGQLWLHESYETTIRDERHFMNVVNYTVNNPVVAGLTNDFREWPGTFVENGLLL